MSETYSKTNQVGRKFRCLLQRRDRTVFDCGRTIGFIGSADQTKAKSAVSLGDFFKLPANDDGTGNLTPWNREATYSRLQFINARIDNSPLLHDIVVKEGDSFKTDVPVGSLLTNATKMDVLRTFMPESYWYTSPDVWTKIQNLWPCDFTSKARWSSWPDGRYTRNWLLQLQTIIQALPDVHRAYSVREWSQEYNKNFWRDTETWTSFGVFRLDTSSDKAYDQYLDLCFDGCILNMYASSPSLDTAVRLKQLQAIAQLGANGMSLTNVEEQSAFGVLCQRVLDVLPSMQTRNARTLLKLVWRGDDGSERSFFPTVDQIGFADQPVGNLLSMRERGFAVGNNSQYIVWSDQGVVADWEAKFNTEIYEPWQVGNVNRYAIYGNGLSTDLDHWYAAKSVDSDDLTDVEKLRVFVKRSAGQDSPLTTQMYVNWRAAPNREAFMDRIEYYERMGDIYVTDNLNNACWGLFYVLQNSTMHDVGLLSNIKLARQQANEVDTSSAPTGRGTSIDSPAVRASIRAETNPIYGERLMVDAGFLSYGYDDADSVIKVTEPMTYVFRGFNAVPTIPAATNMSNYFDEVFVTWYTGLIVRYDWSTFIDETNVAGLLALISSGVFGDGQSPSMLVTRASDEVSFLNRLYALFSRSINDATAQSHKRIASEGLTLREAILALTDADLDDLNSEFDNAMDFKSVAKALLSDEIDAAYAQLRPVLDTCVAQGQSLTNTGFELLQEAEQLRCQDTLNSMIVNSLPVITGDPANDAQAIDSIFRDARQSASDAINLVNASIIAGDVSNALSAQVAASEYAEYSALADNAKAQLYTISTMVSSGTDAYTAYLASNIAGANSMASFETSRATVTPVCLAAPLIDVASIARRGLRSLGSAFINQFSVAWHVAETVVKVGVTAITTAASIIQSIASRAYDYLAQWVRSFVKDGVSAEYSPNGLLRCWDAPIASFEIDLSLLDRLPLFAFQGSDGSSDQYTRAFVIRKRLMVVFQPISGSRWRAIASIYPCLSCDARDYQDAKTLEAAAAYDYALAGRELYELLTATCGPNSPIPALRSITVSPVDVDSLTNDVAQQLTVLRDANTTANLSSRFAHGVGTGCVAGIATSFVVGTFTAGPIVGVAGAAVGAIAFLADLALQDPNVPDAVAGDIYSAQQIYNFSQCFSTALKPIDGETLVAIDEVLGIFIASLLVYGFGGACEIAKEYALPPSQQESLTAIHLAVAEQGLGASIKSACDLSMQGHLVTGAEQRQAFAKQTAVIAAVAGAALAGRFLVRRQLKIRRVRNALTTGDNPEFIKANLRLARKQWFGGGASASGGLAAAVSQTIGQLAGSSDDGIIRPELSELALIRAAIG